MGTADANSIFWSFAEYVTHNPFKGPSGMTRQDFEAMRDAFVTANSELSTTPTVTDAEWPGTITVTAYSTSLAYWETFLLPKIADQATYPERQKGS